MRILYFVRLFSGLEDGLKNGKWEPKGVPTIAKMIETLDNSEHELELIFACKDYGTNWNETVDRSFQIDGLNTAVTVLAGECVFPAWLGRLRSRFSIMRQTLKMWSINRRFKADIIYIDRGNLWTAAWTARLGNTPVVWRVMGVLAQMRDALDGKDWRSILLRWGFRSPFKAAICTLDGSGGGPWMEKALNQKTERHLLINGVDRESKPSLDVNVDSTNIGKTVVLFVGRLEDNKCCGEFMEAFLAANRQASGAIHAVFVGGGSLMKKLQEMAEHAEQTDSVTFTGAIRHNLVLDWQRRADIYVSLNRVGNLSNANLEALAAGACMVIPASDPQTGIDVDTDNLVSVGAALRFGPLHDVEKLTEAILELHNSPEKRENYSRRARAVSAEVLPEWSMRIKQEIETLERIAGGKSIAEVLS